MKDDTNDKDATGEAVASIRNANLSRDRRVWSARSTVDEPSKKMDRWPLSCTETISQQKD